MSNIEKRITLGKLSLRNADGDYPEISGLAAGYNVMSQDLGGFYEVIKPGAFAQVVKNCDCRCLVNHDPNQILGRTKSGTLQIWDSSEGLRFKCQLPSTALAKDIRESIKRGDIDQCSFAFKLEDGDDSFTPYNAPDGTRSQLRTISRVSHLFDVSAVTYPAYADGTSVSARARRVADYRIGSPARGRARSLEHQIAIDEAVNHMDHILTREEGSPAELRRRARQKMESILAEEARRK